MHSKRFSLQSPNNSQMLARKQISPSTDVNKKAERSVKWNCMLALAEVKDVYNSGLHTTHPKENRKNARIISKNLIVANSKISSLGFSGGADGWPGGTRF